MIKIMYAVVKRTRVDDKIVKLVKTMDTLANAIVWMLNNCEPNVEYYFEVGRIEESIFSCN